MKKWIIAAIALLLCVICVFVCRFVFFDGDKTVLQTENFKISQRVLDYYIDLQKNNYVENYRRDYGDYFLKAAGLNPEESLKKQESCYGGTWYDYFKKTAVKELKNKLLYCEAGKRADLKPDRNTEKSLSRKFELLFSGINKSDLDNITYLEALSQKYLDEFTNSSLPSEKEKTDYYLSNKHLFDCVDYNRIVINTGTDPAANNNAVTELTGKIVASIKKTGFENTLKAFNITDDTELFEVKYEKGYMYDDQTQFGSWAFSGERKAGDTVSFSGMGIETVYYLTKTPYPADYKLKRIQKITVSTDNTGNLISDLYEIGKKLTGDKNTDDNLYAYADEKGLIVEETDASKENLSLALKTWLYDEKRKIGDNTVLEDGFSVSFVRYFADSGSYFENRLTNAVTEYKISNHLKELKKDFKITQP